MPASGAGDVGNLVGVAAGALFSASDLACHFGSSSSVGPVPAELALVVVAGAGPA